VSGAQGNQSFAYDAFARPSSTTGRVGAVTCFSYNAAARSVSSASNGRFTLQIHDGLGRVVRVESRKSTNTEAKKIRTAFSLERGKFMNALIFAILLASASLAQGCTLAIQGVDPEGAPIDVKITSITRFDDPGVDLLKMGRASGWLRVSGSKINFKQISPGVNLLITISRPKESRSIELARIPFFHCGQTATVVMGQRAPDPHAPFNEVRGKLEGCNCAEADFWARLVPMFGAAGEPRWFETKVDSPNCAFSIFGAMRGIRHILIVGRGSDSLQLRDVNVSVGPPMDIGSIDVSSSCRALQ